MPLLQILELGLIDYGASLKLQETLVELRKQGRIADTLLLQEHNPVITLGRNANEKNIVASRAALAERGVEVFEIKRGGDVTIHAPGQLVGYFICDLRGFSPKIGAVEFVRRLEEVLIRACAEFAIATRRIPGLTGVWTRGEDADISDHGNGYKDSDASGADVHAPHSRRRFDFAQGRLSHTQPGRKKQAGREKKIAAIGVHISRGVTSHGFALNVTTALDYFKMIVPCGIRGKPVTSMEAELAGSGRPLNMEAVSQAITRQFGNVFGSQILWLESLDSIFASSLSATENLDAGVGNIAGPENQDTPLKEPEDLRQMREELEGRPQEDISWA